MSDKEVNKAVSRAENKLAAAAEAFHFDFRGKTVLDIGSSTGGFTEYALERGAAKVIAVEKGTKQMKAPLRFDSRIELHEKTDIFQVTAEDFFDGFYVEGETIIPDPDVILADVSFVSLTKVLMHAKMEIARSDTDFLVMLKPQFEARPEQMNKGVIKNEKIRREILREFEEWLREEEFVVIQKRDNELKGKHGNREKFYWLRLAR